MARAATIEQRSRTSSQLSQQPKSIFEELCKAADVTYSADPIAGVGKTLQEVFNMGVNVERIKPDRGISLCPEDGACYEAHWNGTLNKDGSKRQVSK